MHFSAAEPDQLGHFLATQQSRKVPESLLLHFQKSSYIAGDMTSVR